MTILVTGGAGFIGSQVSQALLTKGETVVCVDNLNDYYDRRLKQARLARLAQSPGFTFIEADIRNIMTTLPANSTPIRIVHLAAQAGVRYSLENPGAYVEANLDGFAAVLEYARSLNLEHMVYASSSSVYGANTEKPFSVSDHVNQPISLYAATKRANELMAHSYSELFGIPMTGLRFFTVYGPWGRPDMAYYKFAQAMLQGKQITLYGNGELRRDFTYIDDIVEGVLRCLERPPARTSRRGPDINCAAAPHRVFNLGRGRPLTVAQMVRDLESALGTEANVIHAPRPPGDAQDTVADISETSDWCGYQPKIDFREGIQRFADWFVEYIE